MNEQKTYNIPIYENKNGITMDLFQRKLTPDMEYDERAKLLRESQKQVARETYEKMGIKIIGECDDLFYDVELPNGWVVKRTNHSMWQNVLDEKERCRITFFYKNTFYDRDAFANFERRFSICSTPDYDESAYEQKPEFIPSGQTRTVFVNEYGDRVDKDDLDKMNYIDDSYSMHLHHKTQNRIRKVQEQIMIPNPAYVELTGYEHYSQPFHYEVHDCDGTSVFQSKVVKTDYDYTKEKHREFFKHLESLKNACSQECENWLDKTYPDWKSTLAHWND